MSYKVDNAIIMAAGTSSRFAPLSYEKPKALIEVKGEILIERQIRQLQEAGIGQIILVVGYKKEQFEYLKDKFGVILVENKDYLLRNNNSSIHVVREYLRNTYICSSDNYFSENPFEKEVSDAYYAAVYADGETAEWCMQEDSEGYINAVTIGGKDAWYMLGHAFWNEAFSSKFIKILEDVYELPNTRNLLWEGIYIAHLDMLKLKLRKYPENYIFEFDTLDELRMFDHSYISNTRSEILKTTARVLCCQEADITGVQAFRDSNNAADGFTFTAGQNCYEYIYETQKIRRIKMAKEIMEEDLVKIQKLCENVIGYSYHKVERLGGLTNHTYHVTMKDGKEYAMRIPGDGTEELIVRADERISTKLACDLDIDAQCLYFGADGSKVTEYIPDAVTMSADSLKEDVHIRQIAEIFKKLHTCGTDTGVPFDVFDMAAGYEKIITENNVAMYEDYSDVKEIVMKIKAEIDSICEINIVPCHNDALCENWVTQGKTGRIFLIDWEYAGMNDGIWDLADVSIEAAYDHTLDEKLLKEYLGREIEDIDWKHFLASKIYVDFLWTLWAKTRVPYDGQPMEDWAAERYTRLKNNIKEYQNI